MSIWIEVADNKGAKGKWQKWLRKVGGRNRGGSGDSRTPPCPSPPPLSWSYRASTDMSPLSFIILNFTCRQSRSSLSLRRKRRRLQSSRYTNSNNSAVHSCSTVLLLLFCKNHLLSGILVVDETCWTFFLTYPVSKLPACHQCFVCSESFKTESYVGFFPLINDFVGVFFRYPLFFYVWFFLGFLFFESPSFWKTVRSWSLSRSASLTRTLLKQAGVRLKGRYSHKRPANSYRCGLIYEGHPFLR